MEASQLFEQQGEPLTSQQSITSDEQSGVGPQLVSTGECDVADDSTNDVVTVLTTTKRIDEDVVNKLSTGLLKNCLQEQRTVKKLLHDITESQRVILETLQQENAKFTECQILHEVNDVMEKARRYHTKLLNIKKEMLALHEKSAVLKRRAVKIQQEKQQEALLREQQRERELEKQRKLTAKMAKPSTSKPT